MKRVSEVCNLIPVIAKGDKFDQEYLIKMKNDIFEENKKFDVSFYDVYNAINVLFKIIQTLCNDVKVTNTLTGGSLKFCPPYVIGLNKKYDLQRLFVGLSCKYVVNL
jgi:hypothetical protein